MSIKRSENSYINNDILPFLASNFGYPIHDAERVRINDVPIFRPSGGRGSGSIDIVYYHNDEPVLLVEAKSEHKSHESAIKEALVYLRNFPIDKPEFSPSGLPPKILATTVGKDIKFYKWKIDYSTPIPDFITEEIGILPFEELISYYGLAEEYKARILEPKNFAADFFDELIAIYKYHKKEEKITKDVVKEVVYQIHNYLLDPQKYTGNYPYIELNLQGEKAVRDLFNRFDILNSLGSENAKEFRRSILRSFQGGGLNQYLTEQCVIAFMFQLIGKLSPNTKILDFECGSGGFLVATADINNTRLEDLKGIDIDELPYIVAKTYMAICFRKIGKEELNTIPIKFDNGLFYYGNNWDLVISNPAGSNRYEHGNIEKIKKDGLKYLKQVKGKNKNRFSEYELSIQQAIRSVKAGGKICLVLPEGLFSNSQDGFLREHIAKYCNILAIISLPRGSFKRGTTVKQLKKGAQSASMKMSILYAEKTGEVRKNDGLEIDTQNLNYPVFLAHIEDVKSKSGEIGDWLEERLNVVLEQWHEWQNKAELKSAEKIITKFDREEKTRNCQESLFCKAEIGKIEVKKKKEIKPREVKSKTKISKFLESLFKRK